MIQHGQFYQVVCEVLCDVRLTDCAVTIFAPTKDVSRHIGSPHTKHTPKTPIMTNARPPICLPCPSIGKNMHLCSSKLKPELQQTSCFNKNIHCGCRKSSNLSYFLAGFSEEKISCSRPLSCFAVMLSSQMTQRSTGICKRGGERERGVL